MSQSKTTRHTTYTIQSLSYKIQCNGMVFIITGGSCRKYDFWRDKHVFVATKSVLCLDKSILVATKHLLRLNYVCRDKIFCRDNHTFHQTHVCRDKSKLVATKSCFVAKKNKKKRVLSRQTRVCHDKNETCGSFRQ